MAAPYGPGEWVETRTVYVVEREEGRQYVTTASTEEAARRVVENEQAHAERLNLPQRTYYVYKKTVETRVEFIASISMCTKQCPVHCSHE